jgi:hypothetical protein
MTSFLVLWAVLGPTIGLAAATVLCRPHRRA